MRRVVTCQARGCTRRIPNGPECFCRPHWAMVPSELRDLIIRTYRKIGASASYHAAVAKARDAVENI